MAKRDQDVAEMMSRTGRLLKEDNTTFNEAEMWDTVFTGGGLDVNVMGSATATTLAHGRKTVATAGTAEAVAATTTIVSISVKALGSNLGNVYVGTTGVTAATGYTLEPGDAVSIDIDDPAKVFVDVDNDGEGVEYLTTA